MTWSQSWVRLNIVKRLAAVLLILPQLAAAEPVRRDLTLDIIPLKLGDKTYARPQRIVYRLFPGVDAEQARRVPGRIPYLPIISISMDEGPVLETIVWGGTGALAGTLIGPAGTLVGAALGCAAGFVIGCLYKPAKIR